MQVKRGKTDHGRVTETITLREVTEEDPENMQYKEKEREAVKERNKRVGRATGEVTEKSRGILNRWAPREKQGG